MIYLNGALPIEYKSSSGEIYEEFQIFLILI